MPNLRSNISRRIVLAGAAVAAGLSMLAAAPDAAAQAWPSKPVKFVVPYGPGASNDTFTRALAQVLNARTGKSFIVENRPGASGWIGAEVVIGSPADGYTLLEQSSGFTSIGIAMKNGFDPSSDLTPISMIARSPNAVLATSAVPELASVKGLIDYAKAHPNETFFGSSGVGSSNHLDAEQFNLRAGTKMVHVPYKSLADALTDLAGGRIHVIFGTVASGASMIAADKVRLLGYGADGRTASAPSAPLVRDTVANYDAKVWWGIFGPKNMPADLRATLNQAINESLGDPAFTKLFESSGATAAPMSADAFTEIVRKDVANVKEVVAAANIKFE